MTDQDIFTTDDVHRWIDAVLAENQAATKRFHAQELELWRDSMALRMAPFLPGGESTFAGPDDTHEDLIHQLAFEFRLSQSVSTVATANLAMHATLTGSYTQALNLYRNLGESWKRTAYVRKRPNEVGRWMSAHWIEEFLGAPLTVPKSGHQPKPHEWNDVFPTHSTAKRTDTNDRLMLDTLNKYLDQLNAFVHPNFDGYTPHLGANRRQINLVPPYTNRHAKQALHLANVIEFTWLGELSLLLTLSDDWYPQVQDWQDRFKKVYADRTAGADNTGNTGNTYSRASQNH
jgi:hypothetical protein